MVPDQDDTHDMPSRPMWQSALASAARFASPARAIRSARAVLPWARENRLKAVLAGVGGLAVTALLGTVVGTTVVSRRSEDAERTLMTAFQELDAGNYGEARRLAERVRQARALPIDDLGGPALVLGAAAVYEAEASWEIQDKPSSYAVAARYLEEARDRGFPPDRRSEGLYLLAKSLYRSGRHAQSVPALKEALKANPRRKTEIYKYLVDAYLFSPNPQPEESLRASKEYLTDRMLSPEQRQQGLLVQCRILFQLGDIKACKEMLAKIPLDARIHGEALVMQGRLLMREADRLRNDPDLVAAGTNKRAAAGKLTEAIKVLRRAQVRSTLSSPATHKSSYLIGVAYRKLGDKRAAAEQFGKTRRLFSTTPEGWAASLEEAELLQELGQDNDALAAYQRVMSRVKDPDRYSNPWVSLDQLQGRLNAAYSASLKAGRFGMAVEIAKLHAPLFPHRPAYPMQLRAEARRTWAQTLERSAADLPEFKAEPIRAQARAQLRRAGWTYARLAEYHITSPEYPEDLWHSAENYLKGHSYRRAVPILREYLEDPSRRKRPMALVGLGEALLALGNVDEALEALNECIQLHPKDPAVYRAQLLGSQAYLEKKNGIPKAKRLLLDNLHNEALTPKSIEWRDSLFALGELLYREGITREAVSRRDGIDLSNPDSMRQGLKELDKSYAAFQESTEKLSEAVERYPNAPQAIRARYLIAQSHRQSARLPQKKLETVTIETMRIAINRQIQEQLAAAYEAYDQLQRLLDQKMEHKGLSETEKLILRNCSFARGGVLFDLGRYEEAIRAYSTATNRYQHEPAAMEAYTQIASCYRHLGKPVDARGTLEQAKIVLKRIRPDADFTRTTRYDRDRWTGLLDWLSNL